MDLFPASGAKNGSLAKKGFPTKYGSLAKDEYPANDGYQKRRVSKQRRDTCKEGAQKQKDPEQRRHSRWIPCKHGSLAKRVPNKDGFTLLYPTTYAKIKKKVPRGKE